MKTWVRRLGAMSIAIGLLVLILAALAAGTIVESLSGSDAAGRAVYDALWFRILLGAFALNVACAVANLWPWGRARIGFLLTHGSLLLILAGAVATLLYKSEGQLALWEGEEGAAFQGTARAGEPEPPPTALPFSVRLEAFEIDTYPGTERPAMFRSRVTVRDLRRGIAFPAVIEMNRDLAYGGYRLFQSGYQRTRDRDQTVLVVSRDPGEPIVFAGYGLLLAGMLTVLGTRIAQQRAARPVRPERAVAARRAAALLAGVLIAPAFAPPATASAAGARAPDAPTVERLRRLPVQHDGRVMPLDTVAREAVRQVTGSASWRGADPVAVALGWAFDPDRSVSEALVRLGPGLAEAIGLAPGTTYASFGELARNRSLLGLFERARAEAEADRTPDGTLREARRVEERLVAMQGFLQGDVFRVIPDPSDPRAAWSAPARVRAAGDLAPYLAPAGTPALEREVLYNRVRPSRLAWWILAPAAIVSVLAWSGRRRLLDLLALSGLVAGFAVMSWGIAMRWIIAGRIPASNMYESLLFLGWGVGLFALAALVILRNRLVVLNATAMAALTMVLADRLPIDPFIHPMPPVLSGTPWLAIHVPIIMLSYSVLALGVVVAHMQIGVLIVAPARRAIAFRMNDLLYWYLHVGTILLVAGIITGSIWAASSWGRYWGWDPKEVWSLVAFLAYVAILHGRFDRLIGPFGVAALSIVAFWTILMTYVGVNYVLAAGLHSYGFGGSGVVRWLVIVAGAEALFLALGYFAHAAGRPGAGPAGARAEGLP